MKPAAALVLVVSVLLAAASGAVAAPAVNGVFPVKSIDSNSKIVAGADGNMWMAQTGAGSNVSRITPAGTVAEFELGLLNASGIAAGPEGRLWITATNEIASFLPADPKNTLKKTTNAAIAGNSPLVFGPDGNIWVASNEVVLRISPSKPKTSTPFALSGLTPKDIDIAGSLLVVADGNAGKKRIATFTTAGTEKDVPIGEASQGVAGGSGGQFAYTAPDAKEVGLVTPPGAPKPITVENDPFGIALGSDGAYWTPRSAKEGIERVTSSGETTFLGGLPKKFFPRQIAPGPNNTLWVTMEIPGENEFAVARVSGLEPPVVKTEPTPPPPATKPQTKIGKGPKGKVKTTKNKAAVTFRFSSDVAGSKFECALTRVRKGKKVPKPAFKSCKSPKTYRLKPGRYRFRVRAVANGLVDGTPASRAFSVIHLNSPTT